MSYKLKTANGKVEFLLKTGKDFVRNQMTIASAQHIIDTGELVESDKPEYPICVGNQWYFEGTEVKKKVQTTSAQGEMKNEK